MKHPENMSLSTKSKLETPVHRLPHAWPEAPEDWKDITTCRTCGLSILRLFVESARWVTRRVETIEFLDDRTVRRRVSVNYSTPGDAPVFREGAAPPFRVLPIAAMRRKSLINFNFRDDGDRAIPLIGLRDNQKLTVAVLLTWAREALAACEDRSLMLEDGSCAARVITDIVEGDHNELNLAWKTFECQASFDSYRGVRLRDKDRRILTCLGADRCFRLVAERLADNFLLFVLETSDSGERRVVKFSYDEPLTARYSAAGYTPHAAPDAPRVRRPRYEPQLPRPWWKDPLAGLGLRAALVRFPVPSAELAASFHLEIKTPPGASIVEASLLAGLPNLFADADDRSPAADNEWWYREGTNRDPLRRRRRPSYDFVGPGYPTVDLHVADVPYGSLSRGQVFLRARPQGWLATSAVCSWVAAAALWATASFKPNDTDIAATVLVTLAAALVTLVIRDDEHRMVTRLLGLLKLTSAATVGMLVIGAVALASFGPTYGFLRGCAVAAVILACPISLAWALSAYSLRDRGGRDLDYRSVQSVVRRRKRPWSTDVTVPADGRPPTGSRLKRLSHFQHQLFVRESPWEQYRPRDEFAPAGADMSTERQRLQLTFSRYLDSTDFPYDEAVRLLRFDCPAIRVASAEGARMTFYWNRDVRNEFMTRVRQ